MCIRLWLVVDFGFADVDECAQNTDTCSHICRNTIGGYECSCHDNYRLKSDETTCLCKSILSL